MKRFNKTVALYMVSMLLFTAAALPVLSALAALGDDDSSKSSDDDMALALSAYKRHDYKEAIGHLGAAAPQEYNNANLHYYLANCMVHLRQKDCAIREYRIAYALQPKGTIGKYCKQCLFLFGIDAEGKVEEKKKDKDKDKDQEKGKDNSKEKGDPGLASVSKFLSEDDKKVADNLDDLIKQKARPGAAKLQKIGTNIFVRNYKDPNAAAANTQNKSTQGKSGHHST